MINKSLKKIDFFLIENKILFEKNIDSFNFSWLKSGGKVQYLIYPQSQNDIKKLVLYCKKNCFEYDVIGQCSNILFLDFVEYGIFFSTKLLNKISITKSNIITAECGALLYDLVRFAHSLKFKGFEGLEGIPGTIGGGIIFNAGAYGYEISDYLISTKWLYKNKIIIKKKKEFNFSHRSKIPKDNGILISADFKFPKNSSNKDSLLIEKFHSARHRYQEQAYPNLGSIFITYGKNINDILVNSDFYIEKYGKINSIIKIFLFKVNRTKLFSIYRKFFPFFNFYSFFLYKKFPELFESNCLSKRTINTLANRNCSSIDFLKSIHRMQEIMPSLKMENEIYANNIINYDYEIYKSNKKLLQFFKINFNE